MKTFETIKKALKAGRENTKGFNRAFYNTFISDVDTIRKARERDPGFNCQAFWKNSATAKTYFYNKNGGSYCFFFRNFL